MNNWIMQDTEQLLKWLTLALLFVFRYLSEWLKK